MSNFVLYLNSNSTFNNLTYNLNDTKNKISSNLIFKMDIDSINHELALNLFKHVINYIYDYEIRAINGKKFGNEFPFNTQIIQQFIHEYELKTKILDKDINNFTNQKRKIYKI